jgi:release factor glutamine methyltransferase
MPHAAGLCQNYGAATRLGAQLGLEAADAAILIAHRLQIGRTTLLAFPERTIEPAQARLITTDLQARARGVPVAYLRGWQEFYGLQLSVNHHVLIPRADTETLVEAALARFGAHSAIRMLDLGTGSGAIALACKHSRPHWQVWATDLSQEALTVARANATQLGLEVQFLHGAWFSALSLSKQPHERELAPSLQATPLQFDLIVSNPPYIARHDSHLEQGDLRFEPAGALSADEGGMADLREIITQASTYLAPGGWLMLEHGYDQACAVATQMRDANFSKASTINDLAGNARVGVGCFAD